MDTTLQRINSAETDQAEAMFCDCCGSVKWASAMAASRPFESESELMETAASIWDDLDARDWLEAFAAHPMIGETKPASSQPARSAKWSEGEQAGMGSAVDAVKEDLAAANRAYYEKFGFIFIVCATGKSAEEMLRLCRSRITNDRDTEIAIAAGEQQKITEIRLRKLLEL